DVKTIMKDKGSALMGIGVATGESRAIEAAKKAISSPLLETTIDGAKGVLMNISGGPSLSLFEVQEAADLVTSAADDDVNVIFGNVINENLDEEVIVTVIATGFDEVHEEKTKRRASPMNKSTETNDQVNKQRRNEETTSNDPFESEETLDIPTFLRNRNRNRE